jgi:hypothetical protein
MSIRIERVVEATTEVHDLIGELNDVLGAAYEAHQRHGLSIEQLFDPNVRFFVARRDGLAVGCGGVAMFEDYAEIKRMYTRPAARSRMRPVEQASRSCASKPEHSKRRRSVSINAWDFGHGSVRPVCSNACPQHRDQPLFRKGARVARIIRPERPTTA